MWTSVREFTDRAAKAQSVEALNQAFASLVAGWGFGNFVAIQVSSRQNDIRAPGARSFGQPLISWLHHYRDAGYIHRDVGIARIMTSTEPYWWSEIQSGPLSHDQLQVFGEAAEFGLSQGLVVPVRQPDGSVWSCLLTADDIEENDDVKFAAVVAANYYVGRGALLQAKENRRIDLAYKLTKRQREVVTWLARGLTSDEIGEVLGTSGRTVAHQLDEAKRRLNARTLASLVAEAVINAEVSLATLQ
jgi:DNA-binding CsgD family transcriptional regulator